MKGKEMIEEETPGQETSIEKVPYNDARLFRCQNEISRETSKGQTLLFPNSSTACKTNKQKQNTNITKQTKNDPLSQEGRIDRLSALTEKKTMWIINENVPLGI